MKNTAKLMTLAAVMVVGTAAFAGPANHRHHCERDGLDLAYGIVNLVTRVIAPPPVVVHQQPVLAPPPPVVVHQQPIYHQPPQRKPPRRKPITQHHKPAPPRRHHR